jgi:hypothetical protein
VPATCPCCGDSRLRKKGRGRIETLKLVPRRWKVIRHVREKLVCRACEAITQPPAPRSVVQGQICWPMSCSPSTACTLHLPLHRRVMSTNVKASISMYRRSGNGRCLRGNLDASGRCDPEPSLRSRAHPRRPTVPVSRARPGPAGSAPTCATTVRLPARIRRRPCSYTRPIVAVRIRSSIWRDMPGGCGPTPTPASAVHP